jgi:hypothetical protein
MSQKRAPGFEQGTFVVTPADGSPPYRTDGQPLTQIDRDMLDGKDPLDAPKEKADSPVNAH